MKKAGEPITLRVLWHDGGMPQTGDELRTSKGRRYLILTCTEKKIEALVLAPDAAPTTGKTWCWTWGSRKPRRP